ncbi:MAG: hypothetical protein JWL72_2597 [Ilumatobacteraceae bacterium]|nr:hypothetical protein [Ilumatobacteraceae bacterium]
MVASSSESAVRDPVRDLLEGLEAGDDLETVYRSVGSSFGFGSKTSPRGLLDLAASAFAACGASSASPLVLDELESRYLAEWPARGNTAHQKRCYAIQAAILIASGVEPEDTSWWRLDDVWVHAFDAVVVFVRAAADRQRLSVAAICGGLRPA